jgi:predicted membrane channel-forming protein YqfA (hemolysin III family)
MKTQCWQPSWDKLSIFTAIVPITVGVALMTTMTAPVSAQPVILVERGMVSRPLSAGSLIYGSPIPTPIPVHSTNGLLPSPTYYSYPASPRYYSYPSPTYYSYPPRRRTVVNSTLFNPILVNPTIRDSTLINPVILDDPGRQIPVHHP